MIKIKSYLISKSVKLCKSIMKVLWFTWKDLKNPASGGAEVVNEELCKRLTQDGHEVIIITAGFKNLVEEEIVNGYKIIRVGNKWSVYWQAYKYYKKNLQGWADLVIDEMNTIPFFCKYYVKEKNIMFVHQLCRQIWFYQMLFPFSLIGYVFEPVYLWLLNNREVITVSESTKKDLMKFGFKQENINIISEGIELQPIADLESIEKYQEPTILSLGSIRSMKRTLHIVKAFELAKKEISELKLKIAGENNSRYGQRVLSYIKNSKHKNSIEYLGKVSKDKKIELMQKSHLICVTSVKEGWGLIVTEANSQGTPAVVYDVDGLRDSVVNNQTGLICKKNNSQNLAKNIILLLKNLSKYDRIRESGWLWSKHTNFDLSYKQFSEILKLYE